MDKDKHEKDFRHIVRIVGTDLPGNKKILYSLRAIKGVNFLLGNALCKAAEVDPTIITGNLSDGQIEKFSEVIKNPANYGLPAWMFNRKFDPETGKDVHLFGPEINFTKENDIKTLRKIKSYKGFRHAKGLPVRGQRTKSNFRRNKGKSLGVSKKR